jgi:hypothetical protein
MYFWICYVIDDFRGGIELGNDWYHTPYLIIYFLKWLNVTNVLDNDDNERDWGRFVGGGVIIHWRIPRLSIRYLDLFTESLKSRLFIVLSFYDFLMRFVPWMCHFLTVLFGLSAFKFCLTANFWPILNSKSVQNLKSTNLK